MAPLVYVAIQSGRLHSLSNFYQKLYQWQALHTAKQLLQVPGVCEVYLHGSTFRGDFNAGVSDLDLVVEVSNESPSLHDQIRAVFRRRKIFPIHCDYSVIPQSARFHEFRLGSIFSEVIRVSDGAIAQISPVWEANRLTASRLRFLSQTYRKLYRHAKLGALNFRMERVLRLRMNRFEMVADDVLRENAPRTSFVGAHNPFVGRGKTFSQFFYDRIDAINQTVEERWGRLNAEVSLHLHSHIGFRVASVDAVRSARLEQTYLVPPGIGSLLQLFEINQRASGSNEELRREILSQHALLMSNRLRRYILPPAQPARKVVEWLQMWTLINQQLCPGFDQNRASEIIAKCRGSIDNNWVRDNFNSLIQIFEEPFFKQ